MPGSACRFLLPSSSSSSESPLLSVHAFPPSLTLLFLPFLMPYHRLHAYACTRLVDITRTARRDTSEQFWGSVGGHFQFSCMHTWGDLSWCANRWRWEGTIHFCLSSSSSHAGIIPLLACNNFSPCPFSSVLCDAGTFSEVEDDIRPNIFMPAFLCLLPAACSMPQLLHAFSEVIMCVTPQWYSS